MENLTNGQRLVGVNFNPSEDQRVAKIKQLSADLIDEVTSINSESKVQDSIVNEAVNQIITAQMWAVKALFTK